MSTLTCPKCRAGMPDDALDAGQCPQCGFPLDGPMELGLPNPRRGATRVLLALACVAVLAGAGVAGYAFFGHADPLPAAHEVAALPIDPQPEVPVTYLAPFPHDPKPAEPPNGDQGQPQPAPVAPPPAEPPKKDRPRPIGVVMKVDPKIAPKRHFDHPDDTAALPDLNTGDRVVLTGRVRVLRLGSVNGKGFLDASGLAAEEVVITGDLNNEAQVQVNAPQGKVTVGGYVIGSAKITAVAPGGTVMVANSGRVTGGSVLTVTARRLEVNCPLSGSAKVNVTFTAGGSLKWRLAEDGATITYKPAAPNDPPAIERGELRGGAKVVQAK